MIRTVAVLLALSWVCRGEEPKRVTLDVKDYPLGRLAEHIVKTAGLRIEVDNNAANIPVSLRLRDVPPETIIRVAALKAHVKLEDANNGYRITSAPLDKSLDDLVRALTVQIKSPKVPHTLTSLQGFVHKAARHTFVLDPALENRDVHAKKRLALAPLQATTALELLAMAASCASLDWDIRWGIVFLSTQERLARMPRALPKVPPALKRVLERSSITVHVDAIAITYALELIKTTGRIPIDVDPQAREIVDKRKVAFEFNNLSYQTVLACLVVPHGLRYEFRRDRIVILKAG